MPFWPLSFSGALVLHNHCMSAPLLHADFYPHGAISVWHKRKGHQEMMLWQASSLMHIRSNRANTPAEGKSAASASSSLCTKCLFQDKKPSRFFIKQNTGMRTEPEKISRDFTSLQRRAELHKAGQWGWKGCCPPGSQRNFLPSTISTQSIELTQPWYTWEARI